jgi:parallel beta-helix repeat protein
VVIPNGVDVALFTPRDKHLCRDILSLPREKKIILTGGISYDSDKRKGFDLDGGENYINVEGLTLRGFNDNAVHTIGSTHNIFKKLSIYSNFITGIYLTSGSNYNVIERNTFWDNGHAGIELLNVDYTTIRSNLFTRVDMGNGDGGNGAHIWFVGMGKANHNVIENNVGLRTGGDYNIKDSAFIRVVGNHNIIRHNSAMDFGGIGIAVMHGKENIVINNAIDCTRGGTCINIFKPAVLDGGNRIEYNVFYAKNPKKKYGWNGSIYDSLNAWEKASGYENNNGSDPEFIDPANGNLRLSKDSYCIDKGTGANASIEDFDGTPRPVGEGYDIGAFEYK